MSTTLPNLDTLAEWLIQLCTALIRDLSSTRDGKGEVYTPSLTPTAESYQAIRSLSLQNGALQGVLEQLKRTQVGLDGVL